VVGKTLGHYEILEPLGKGGMGEVYRARDTKLGQPYAVSGFLLLLAVGLACFAEDAEAQEPLGLSWRAEVSAPAFPRGLGPRVCIDQGHNNYHTAGGRYGPFASLLRDDGYVVEGIESEFSIETLQSCRILVIVSPLAEGNDFDQGGNWAYPHSSAFSPTELNAVVDWTRGGGMLLLIVDHAPWPGAAGDLGLLLGVVMLDGHADVTESPDVFRSKDTRAPSALAFGTLGNHPIFEGRSDGERVDSVVTFGGHAFWPSQELQPLLIFDSDAVADIPLSDNLPGVPRSEWPRISIAGWLQGAAGLIGGGKFVILGEAAMCTAQVDEGEPWGMNHPLAIQNAQFCLNVLHWLSGIIGE